MEAPPATDSAERDAERAAVRAKNADAAIKQYKLDERLDQWQLGAMRDILQQHHVFITGSAGNGKSHLIQTLHAYCAAALKPCAVTSMTGVTALHIGGETLARFMSFGVAEGDGPTLWAHVSKNKHLKYVKQRMMNVSMIVIDEISMLSAETFEAVSYVLAKLRDQLPHTSGGKPFGGVQMIFCGDFSQLPPVKGHYAFLSPLWDQMVSGRDGSGAPGAGGGPLGMAIHELKGSHRQSDDVAFYMLLNSVRVGEITTLVRNCLKSRVGAKLELPDGVLPSELTSRRDAAAQINLEHIAKLPADTEHKYDAKFTWTRGRLTEAARKMHEDIVRKNMITPAELVLRTGAQVMLTSNLDLSSKLANGSRGVVVGFGAASGTSPSSVPQAAAPAAASAAAKKAGTKEVPPPVEYPRVLFTTGLEMVITPNKWKNENAVEHTCLVYEQVPLAPAYAVTVHKSQGCTLDAVSMAIDSSMFCDGSAYVALSRVRSLKGMTLTSFNPNSIRTSSLVTEFYRKHGLAGVEAAQTTTSSTPQ